MSVRLTKIRLKEITAVRFIYLLAMLSQFFIQCRECKFLIEIFFFFLRLILLNSNCTSFKFVCASFSFITQELSAQWSVCLSDFIGGMNIWQFIFCLF